MRWRLGVVGPGLGTQKRVLGQQLELDESLCGGAVACVPCSIAVLKALRCPFMTVGQSHRSVRRTRGHRQVQFDFHHQEAPGRSESDPLNPGFPSFSAIIESVRRQTRSARRSRFPIRPVMLLWRWVAR